MHYLESAFRREFCCSTTKEIEKIAQRTGTDSFSVFRRSAVHVAFELWLGIPDLSWHVDDHRSHTSSCKSQTNTPQRRKKALLRPWYPISGSHAASPRSSRSCSRSSTTENGWSPGKETIPKIASRFLMCSARFAINDIVSDVLIYSFFKLFFNSSAFRPFPRHLVCALKIQWPPAIII